MKHNDYIVNMRMYARAGMAIYLNYVGRGAYSSANKFIEEAKKYRAQRACSYSMLKQLLLSNAVVYYARYMEEDEEEEDWAWVFAKGRAIGLATTMQIKTGLGEKVREVLDEGYIGGKAIGWVERGCGSYKVIESITIKDFRRLFELIESNYSKEQINAHKWFIITDIEEYNAEIRYLIKYKKGKIISKGIEFSRGFICLCGYADKRNRGVAQVIDYYKQLGKRMHTTDRQIKLEEVEA